jgi:hypothetical protein
MSNGRAHRVRVQRLIIGGVTPHAEGDAESPGSGGASPYLRRGSRVNLGYKLAPLALGGKTVGNSPYLSAIQP